VLYQLHIFLTETYQVVMTTTKRIEHFSKKLDYISRYIGDMNSLRKCCMGTANFTVAVRIALFPRQQKLGKFQTKLT